MDIRTMPAGPELDAELARTLGLLVDGTWVPGSIPFVMHPPSTTWEGAGQAIEEMQRRDYTILILMEPGHPITVEVSHSGPLPIAIGYGETLPLAATRAFVLALQKNEEAET